MDTFTDKVVRTIVLVCAALAITAVFAVAAETTFVNELPGWDCQTAPTVTTVTSLRGIGTLVITYTTNDGKYAIVTLQENEIVDGVQFSSEYCE